jgi:hypothetical protein
MPQEHWNGVVAALSPAAPRVADANWRGKVVPFVPRAQPLFSYVNPAGKLEYDFKKLGFAHNPIVPHTIVRESRSCASCHANDRTVGLGLFTSREHPKLIEFKQGVDFRWDRIVDEHGVPQQVTTVEGARPFNAEEIERMRRAPYKHPPRPPTPSHGATSRLIVASSYETSLATNLTS